MFAAKPKKYCLKSICSIVIVVILIFVIFTGLSLANKGKISYGLKLAGIPIGGLTVNDAKQKIAQEVEAFLNQEITLKYVQGDTNKTWTVLPEEIGIAIDVNLSILKASKIGHQKKLFPGLWQQLTTLLNKHGLTLSYATNQEKLEQFINEKLGSINSPAINASWQYDQELDQFVQIPSQTGAIINQKELLTKLGKKVENLNKNDIYLNLIPDKPEILEQETITAREQANLIIENSPYLLTAISPLNQERAEIYLTKSKIITLIKFKPTKQAANSDNIILGVDLKQKKLEEYLNTLSSSINKSPINAKFIIEDDRVTEFNLSQNGARLEIKKNIEKIKQEILVNNSKKISLETSIVPPNITIEETNNLGIHALLGKGISNFGGSSWNRTQNIKIGAKQFDGILIKPGEELSVNKTIGKVGPEQGYKQEYIIKKDKTVPEYGGGLCQVSTTAFRVAVNSGLPITERAPHAFPVSYYNPQGFDATIYPPHPDLRFVNNTPGYILVQTRTEGTYLIFEFYGTDDGRKVEVEGPYQYDMKSDGSMKAVLTRKIYKDGELIEEKSWYSDYKSPSLYPVEEKNPLQ